MTLERVLEAEVMDTLEEARNYDDMDHAEVNRMFVRDLLASVDVRGDVLDLGTGTARIPIELCQRTDDCRVMAVDLSFNMLDVARYNIEVEGLIHRIQLDHDDGKNLPHADEDFDIVISNSIVHHIPEPITVLSEAVRVTRSGGWLFFRDLLRPHDDDTVRQLVDTYAGGEIERSRKMFEDSLRAALNLDEIRALVQQLGYPPASVQASSDRHWTWSVRKA